MACDAGTVLNSASIDSYSDDVWGKNTKTGGGSVRRSTLALGLGLTFRSGSGSGGSTYLPTGYEFVTDDGEIVTDGGKAIYDLIV